MKWKVLFSWVYCILIQLSAALDLQKLRTQVLEALKDGGEKSDRGSPHTRIIGGSQASPGEFPWQASLKVYSLVFETDYHICGGAIISESWILTAAHCLNMVEQLDLPPEWRVVMVVTVGEHVLTIKDGMEQMRHIEAVYGHEDFDKTGQLENDIGLIRVEEPVVFGAFIQSIPLPPEDELFSHRPTCFVSGWGLTDPADETSRPSILQKTSVYVVSDEVCRRGCRRYGCIIFQTMLCAGVSEGGRDACQGDSGGALACPGTDDVLYVAGIVSGGYGCGVEGFYGIYTQISYYRQWIIGVQVKAYNDLEGAKSTTPTTTATTTNTATTAAANMTKKLSQLKATTSKPSKATSNARKNICITLLPVLLCIAYCN